jgi:hypothetical protein
MSIPLPSIAARITEVIFAYYDQIEQFSPAERDLIDWFVQLPRPEKTAAAQVAYDTWLALPGFKRYYLEKKGYAMPAFMARHLTEQELAQWIATSLSS